MAAPRVLYIGGFALPDRTASAQRAVSNAKLFRAAGYEVTLGGLLPDRQSEGTFSGIHAYDIQSPPGLQTTPALYSRDPASILHILDHLGPFDAVICYNCMFPSALRLFADVRSRGFPLAIEMTDYHGFSGRNLYTKTLKWRDSRRLLREAKRARSTICSSEMMQRLLGSDNGLLLPWVVDLEDPKWPAKGAPSSVRRFVYAGSPGPAMKKDRLDLIVESFLLYLDRGGDAALQVVGISEHQFVDQYPAVRKRIQRHTDRVIFSGRVPHAEALAATAEADFSLLLRPPTFANEIGFPTKLVESFACCTPVVANATSDIGDYVKDGETGYLVAEPSVEALTDTIERACHVKLSDLRAMQEHLRRNNPFDYRLHVSRARHFLDNLVRGEPA